MLTQVTKCWHIHTECSGDPEHGTNMYVATASAMKGPWTVAPVGVQGEGSPFLLQLCFCFICFFFLFFLIFFFLVNVTCFELSLLTFAQPIHYQVISKKLFHFLWNHFAYKITYRKTTPLHRLKLHTAVWGMTKGLCHCWFSLCDVSWSKMSHPRTTSSNRIAACLKPNSLLPEDGHAPCGTWQGTEKPTVFFIWARICCK